MNVQRLQRQRAMLEFALYMLECDPLPEPPRSNCKHPGCRGPACAYRNFPELCPRKEG